MLELRKFSANTDGKDYFVGDIHGCYDLIMDRLSEIGFDKSSDRLFSVGDLIDRGPKSLECLLLPAEPWFHAVRGNHEQLMIDGLSSGDVSLWCHNGGRWHLDHSPLEMQTLAQNLDASLPHAIQVETSCGTIGVIHADVSSGNWGEFDADRDIWSRARYGFDDIGPVDGVDVLVVGHTIVDSPVRFHNVVNLDTGAYHTGVLTIVPAEELF